jgi:hypothetical protein
VTSHNCIQAISEAPKRQKTTFFRIVAITHWKI